MKKGLLGKTLLVVTAHPDDESYLAAGTIYENHQAGGKSIIICATLGEKGKSHLKQEVSAAELKRIRKEELRKVSAHLHVWKVHLLNFPDCNVRSHIPDFVTAVLNAIKKYKPDFILGFGPDGVSAHWDHIAAGEVAAKAAKKTGTPLLKFCATPTLLKRIEALAKRRRFGNYKANVIYQKPTMKLKIDSKIKLRALHCHKSQIENKDPFQHLPAKVIEEILNYEYFVEQLN